MKSLFALLILFLTVPAFASTELKDEGTSQGFVNRLDCIGANISCARSGIEGDITIAGGTDAPADAEYLVSTLNGTLSAEDVITDGAGIDYANGVGTATFTTDSTEAAFLAAGALTCGASTAGKLQIHTTPLQYCDNAGTPALQYAAYGSSTGVATSATALAANGANCSASNAPLGVDASGAVESCTDFEEELTNSAGLLAALSDETGTGVSVFGTAPTITLRDTAAGAPTGDGDFGYDRTAEVLEIGDGAATRYAAEANSVGDALLSVALSANGANCAAGSFPLGVDASGAVESCTVGGSGGDSITVATVAATDPDFIAGDITWTLDTGAAPDTIAGTVAANAVALTTDTTGNYAAGDAEAGAALTGDSATSFFSAGTIAQARLGTFTRTFVITGVTAAGDFGAVWRTPAAVTITAVVVLAVGGTNVVGQLDECDTNGANCVTVDSSDITATAGTTATDDNSLSNPSIDANDWVGWHTTSVSGTNTRVSVAFYYTVD